MLILGRMRIVVYFLHRLDDIVFIVILMISSSMSELLDQIISVTLERFANHRVFDGKRIIVHFFPLLRGIVFERLLDGSKPIIS